MNNADYRALEPGVVANITSLKYPVGGVSSFFASSSFLYTLLFSAIVVSAGGMIIYGAILRLVPSASSEAKSREIFWRVLKGVVGTFSFALIFLTFNRDLLRGDIDFSVLGVGAKNMISSISGAPSSSNSTSASCPSADSLKQTLSGGGDVCAGARCSALSGCRFRDYLSIIKSESEKQGVDYKLAIVIMCKESTGKRDATNDNRDGTYDCGLMQINQRGPCTPDSFIPEKNIAEGVRLIKEKTGPSTSRNYPGAPQLGNLFAAYNCCARGAAPYEASVDCTTGSGWPSTLPKWACPINPGSGPSNMCTVRSYACDLNACYKDSSLEGL
jgi:hypothetical protein